MVADAEPLAGREPQHADLAAVRVAVHGVGGQAGLGEREDPRQRGVDHASADEPVGLPGFAVVGEVRPDDALEVHPQVAVVEPVLVAGGGGAGDDGAAAPGHVHARAEGLPARVLEDDVGVVPTGQLADVTAEAPPLAGIGRVGVLPEAVPLGRAVDDEFGAYGADQVGLVRTGHHAHRDATTVEHELGGVRAEAAGRTPDEHHVALLHVGAVARHQLPVGGRVDQLRGGRLLPGEVLRLGHQLVRLDQGQLGQAAVVGFVSPDPLVGVEHRVVVPVG